MKKIILSFIVMFLFSNNLHAASGEADTYTVTMLQVDLCTEVTCGTATTVASGTQGVNIASMSAGAEAAKFGSTAGLPIGTTFTHLRVTLDRTFTISGTVTDGSNGTCTTDGSTEANASTMHVGTKDDTSGQTNTTFEIVDAGSYGSGGNISIAYSSPSSAVSMSVGSPETTQMQLIYALASSYTVGVVAPKIKVSFDVSTAVGGAVDAGGTCRMWPNEPTVTISLTE
tara:strand:+ start:8436 stop:9119 length:684 start_codon:yes stop_codon:yes gene_type:complete